MPTLRQPLPATRWENTRKPGTPPAKAVTLPAGTRVAYADTVRVDARGEWRRLNLAAETPEPTDEIRFYVLHPGGATLRDTCYTATPADWTRGFEWPETQSTDPPCPRCGAAVEDAYESVLCAACAESPVPPATSPVAV